MTKRTGQVECVIQVPGGQRHLGIGVEHGAEAAALLPGGPGVALDDTYTLNPTTVLNIRYGYARFLVNSAADNVGTDLSALGFSPSYIRALPVQAIPQIAISGFTTASGATKLNRSSESTHTLRGTLTMKPSVARDGAITGADGGSAAQSVAGARWNVSMPRAGYTGPPRCAPRSPGSAPAECHRPAIVGGSPDPGAASGAGAGHSLRGCVGHMGTAVIGSWVAG